MSARHYLVGDVETAPAYPASNEPARRLGRPVIVIDPENREQVERLADVYWGRPGHNTTDAFQRALREFANPKPPKPEEPKGDGAVVEDAMGHRWVRIAGPEPERESKPWRHRGHTARDWEHLSAVRILSEGVQA